MKYYQQVRFNKIPSRPSTGFFSLADDNVITRKVSDHHPIIHDGVFFWNMMMQCNRRGNGTSFNNGFGIIEDDKQYMKRLVLLAQVIAKAVYRDSSIEVISLCEGPIKPEHVNVLFNALKTFPFMARFMINDTFHKPTAIGKNWGLLMLADTRYTVAKVSNGSVADLPQLTNRFQLWKLKQSGEEKYIALAHFPFAGDEHKTEKIAISVPGQKYCGFIHTLMQHHCHDHLIFCADFNFNPYLISKWQDRELDKITLNNSILLTIEGVANNHLIKTVTVDGVLLSPREKQKYQVSKPDLNLLGRLKSEYHFFQSNLKRVITDFMQRENNMRLDILSHT